MFPGDPGSTLFDAVCDIENIRLAHYNASRGKQWYPEVKMVNKDIDFYINEIHEMLVNKTYINSSYDKFERHENGKIRLIHKLPYYPDRIIQWALLQVISPILEKNFIRNTYSSIPGRGPIKCMLDVSNAMHKDPYNTQYCLKIDIHHFYQSINHDVLKQKYRRLFKDNDLLWLIDLIIDSIPEKDGLPIGNYTSQYSGNLYLSQFDHWIKEEKKIKYYYRYMDDMIFLSDDKEHLHELFNEINHKLITNEKLIIKPNYQIFPTNDHGIDYVGYVIYHTHVLTRKRIKERFRNICERIICGDALSEHDRSALFSYLGFIQHSDSFNLQKTYYESIKNKFGLQNKIKTNYK